MTFKQIKENKLVRFFSNRYLLVFIVFVIWMIFFDENSYLVHQEFDEEIDKLEADKDYYLSEIKSDTKKIKELEDPELLDKYAREKYKMKKENEDIFIIEYDTVKK
ncbi:FtsB family cell division protein [Urechidicola croceus]|uniref:Septum formation initiator n=1 Tax=Urechidicola croceus TaxID=1850246 RepID=A0A1D8PAV3_9FLAO|nr:septum formation initiator family protein [Urechidicola croceus]AOW21713.1 septum formation initiator [Urechidicola croceus]